MAGTASVVSTPNSGNTWLEGILWGTEWSSGGTTTVVSTYIAGRYGDEWLPDTLGSYLYASVPFTKEVTAMTAAMASYEAVCNINFRMVSSPANADLVWASVGSIDAGGASVAGWSSPPGIGFAFGDDQSLVAMNYEAYRSTGSSGFLAKGSIDFCVFIHELGHALGLAHPHDSGGDSTVFSEVGSTFGDFGNYGMNQGIYTMMSYNNGWRTAPHGPSPSANWGYQAGPMALDIAALQFLYGANTTYRTGSDTYTLPGANQVGTYYSCIWDADGTDRILGASDRGNTIDLRAATLQMGAGGGGYVSYAKGIHGGFTIAKGAVIENATGGNSADKITGNQVANLLTGLGGGDSLRGLSGNDTLDGRAGNDVLTGGAGRDILKGGTGSDDFVFLRTSDSAPTSTTRDVISGGFSRGSDDIGVSNIDAKAGITGNQAFALDTNGSFLKGEIRQKVISSGLLIEFNTDGDSSAEMAILIQGMSSKLAGSDFML